MTSLTSTSRQTLGKKQFYKQIQTYLEDNVSDLAVYANKRKCCLIVIEIAIQQNS